MKIKLITHTDLDGLVCSLVVRRFYRGVATVDETKCNYNNVNGAIYNIIKTKEIDEYDKVYITDISCSEKMADWIDKEFKDKFVLLDHHSTATWMNKYSWCTVKTESKNGEKIAGADVVAEHLGVDKNNNVFNHILHINKKYDTWAWKEENYIFANEVNKVAYMVGFDEITKEFEHQIELCEKTPSIGEFKMRTAWQFLLEIDNKKYQNYLESSNKAIQIREIDGFKFGYVFAENYISELGNDLAVINSHLDFIAIINLRTGVSLRGIKDIHLGDIAKKIGERLGCNSGGHKNASGISITNDFKDKFVDSIFYENKANNVDPAEMLYWKNL